MNVRSIRIRIDWLGGLETDSYSKDKATTAIGGPKGTGKGTMSCPVEEGVTFAASNCDDGVGDEP